MSSSARPRPSPLRLAAGFLALLAVPALRAAAPGPAAGPRVVPFLPDAARELGEVRARVLVALVEPGTAELLELRVLAAGERVASLPLTEVLAGDPLYASVQGRLERLPTELTGRRRPRGFAPEDAPGIDWREVPAELDALRADLADLRAAWAAGVPRPFAEVGVALDLARVLGDVEVGDARELVVEVDWAEGEAVRTARATVAMERLAPFPPVPATLQAALGPLEVHAGDLHVHSCRGEAVNACPPSEDCPAESLQTAGSFTYAELAGQYQALGLDWFAATDHSYCIDSDAEYAGVVAEAAALTGPGFAVLPDLELSSDEVGPQEGSDAGDLVCLGTTSANHMGAHGIHARLEGGDDGFLGFCDGLFGGDALAELPTNVAAVRAQGGWPVVNHPDGIYGWNSFEATHGLELGELHGVEIWNGPTQAGQGGHVGRWVQWLLDGRVLYAYSGSDTHDEAFSFGANHALLAAGLELTPERLQRALRRGRSFVSNHAFLYVEVDEGGATLPMGTLQGLAPGHPAGPLAVRVHYDLGTDVGKVTVFAGREGDPAESVLCESDGLSGAGVLTCPTTLDPTRNTWFRAYAEDGSGAHAAYTNPVFFLPSACGYAPFGTGLGGANVATLASASSPTLGAWNALELGGFGAATGAVLLWSPVALPDGYPLAGGFLVVGAPLFVAGVVPLSAGGGSLSFEVPADPALAGAPVRFQAVAPLASLPGGFAFSSGLGAELCPPGG